MLFPGLFAILVGIVMIVQWWMSYRSHQIPELKTEPVRIGFHIAGEIFTAVLLITSGSGLLLSLPWAPTLFYIAMGMLFYTAIVSPGYFAQKGQWIWLLMFAVLILLGIAAVIAL